MVKNQEILNINLKDKKMKRNVWKLIGRPEGTNFESALSLVEEELSNPTDGQIQILN